MLEQVTRIAFVLHVAGGVIGLLAGIVATATRKGGRIHRQAGNIFFVAMLMMAAFAVYLGFVRPGAFVNVFIGTFVAYLITTSWITVRRPAGSIGLPEKTGLVAGLLLCAPFVLLSLQLALHLPPLVPSVAAFHGPILIAIYVFTLVLVIAAGGDLVMVLSGGLSGAARLARHLWRMCVALTLATGSALSNGLPRLLPAPYEMPDWTLYLQLVWVVVLLYWLVRVRLPGRSRSRSQIPA